MYSGGIEKFRLIRLPRERSPFRLGFSVRKDNHHTCKCLQLSPLDATNGITAQQQNDR